MDAVGLKLKRLLWRGSVYRPSFPANPIQYIVQAVLTAIVTICHSNCGKCHNSTVSALRGKNATVAAERIVPQSILRPGCHAIAARSHEAVQATCCTRRRLRCGRGAIWQIKLAPKHTLTGMLQGFLWEVSLASISTFVRCALLEGCWMTCKADSEGSTPPSCLSSKARRALERCCGAFVVLSHCESRIVRISRTCSTLTASGNVGPAACSFHPIYFDSHCWHLLTRFLVGNFSAVWGLHFYALQSCCLMPKKNRSWLSGLACGNSQVAFEAVEDLPTDGSSPEGLPPAELEFAFDKHICNCFACELFPNFQCIAKQQARNQKAPSKNPGDAVPLSCLCMQVQLNQNVFHCEWLARARCLCCFSQLAVRPVPETDVCCCPPSFFLQIDGTTQRSV